MSGHGRYPYRPIVAPAGYRWPEGNGLAVNLETYDFDAEHLDEIVANPARPDLISYGWLDWGNRVGAWRPLEAMQEVGIPATAPVNSSARRRHPRSTSRRARVSAMSIWRIPQPLAKDE
jgi:allantoinase